MKEKQNYREIIDHIKGRIPVLFLDYDGTLTPIVSQPEDALLSEEMREVLEECSRKFKVAVISGRDMDDLKGLVGLDNLIYAGSHGFRISGPDELYKEHEKSEEIIPVLGKIEAKLHEDLDNVDEGIRIERKRYAIAVHFRNARESSIPVITERVNEVIKDNTGFKKGEGKKILEVKPAIDWHKGKALLWILEKLCMTDVNKFVPVYIGDDITDEDAFSTIKDFGIGILVGSHGQDTAAKYNLEDVDDVKVFLKELSEKMS
jgi:trehalose 6-phosphate phosphatase